MALLQNILVTSSTLIFTASPVAAVPLTAPQALPNPIKPMAALSQYKAATAPQPLQPVYIPPPTFPIAPAGTYANSYAPGQCTSYVAGRIKIPNSWSNANMWAIRAAAEGITVSSVPLQGSIGQTSRGVFGHVVVVLQVGNGQVLIAEQNYDFRGSIRERWAATSEFVYIWV